MLFLEQFYSLPPVVIYVFLAAVFSFVSFVKKTFSIEGIVFGNIVALLAFLLGGLESFLVLALFFVIAETATQFSRKKIGVAHETRTASNVLGNAGAALIALFFGQVPAFFGGISAGLSDTLSSEIGLLSKTKPRLITSLKKVEAGTNGGITLLGMSAAFFGSLVCSIAFYAATQNYLVSLFVFIAGIVGTTIDSILGALLENRGTLNKMQVNFLSTLAGALSVYILQVFTFTL